MNGTTLLLALIGHLVGDYLLQNDWLALHKKKSSIRCLIHCLIWTWSVMLFSGWWAPHCFTASVTFFVLLITHFIQDRTNIIAWWMDFIGQTEFKKSDDLIRQKCPPIENGEPLYFLKVGLGPWSVIVVDNIWHIVTIWAVWRFIA